MLANEPYCKVLTHFLSFYQLSSLSNKQMLKAFSLISFIL